MPFISDTAMQKVATKLQSFETREEKRKVEVRQKLNEAANRQPHGARFRGYFQPHGATRFQGHGATCEVG